jgi:hypothetical protein
VRKGRLVWGVIAVLAGATIGAVLLARDGYSCAAGATVPLQVHRQNHYVFSCKGALYLPAPSTRAKFHRTGVLSASEAEVLPFKFVRAQNRVYFVGYMNNGFDENEYFLRPIDGVDVRTMEIVDESHVRDARSVYTVLREHFIVEPRTGQ